jgi:hypothetical protein
MTFDKLALGGMAVAIAVAALPMNSFAQHGGPPGPPLGGPLFHVLAALGGKVAAVNRQAMHVFKTLPRYGTCEERRNNWLAILPDAVQFARYSRDIYDTSREAEMRKARESSRRLGEGHFAYFDEAGQRYAELRVDDPHGRVVVIFRGTRLEVRSDVTTNVLNFVGIETRYYDWAASFVARIGREHPDRKVVVTGHSLGGGLALYAALKNPGVQAFVFNPSGLSEAAWNATSPRHRARLNESATVVSLRNFWAIEPVTALSLAGRSVLPGHVFVLQASALRPAKLHTASAVVSALEETAEQNAAGSACDGDLGILVE